MEGPSKPNSGYVEFKLRSASSTNFVHNIMTLTGPPVNMADFTTPVRLVRDPTARREDTDGNSGIGGGSEDEDRNIGRKKKKTRILQQEDEDEASLRAQERVPWLLEDFDGQHSYVSQLMAPDAKYVIFVNQENEFRVLLASKWYRFTPKLSYRPLSLEEAEERMAGKGRNEDFDRWLMRKRDASNSLPVSGETSGTASVPAQKGPKVATRMVNLEEEGFDFEEFVDDDDGDVLYHRGNDEDDPSMPRIERPRQKKNLTDAGKQVRKLVKHLDRHNYFYDSEEEDAHDPYADEEDKEESEGEGSTMPTIPVKRPPEARPSMSTLPPKIPHSARSSADSLPISSGRQSRSKSPVGSRSRSKSPVENRSQDGGNILAEGDIIAILREGPLRTKDLIGKVKHKLRADPQNKDIFREIVRRVATVRTSVSQEDDKLLELRPEYLK